MVKKMVSAGDISTFRGFKYNAILFGTILFLFGIL